MPTKPLQVLYLIDSLDSGGAQRQMSYLLSAVDRDRVSPTLALYHPRFHFGDDLDPGVAVHVLGDKGGKDPRVLVRLNRLLRHQPFDLVHAMLRSPGQLARLAALMPRRLGHIPIIVSERDLFLGRSRHRLWLERALCGRAAAMIVNSERARQRIEAWVPGWRGRIHEVVNGVRLDPLSSAEQDAARRFRSLYASPGTRLLGIVARIDRNKGPDLVASALGRLPPDTAARLSLVWVGAEVDPQAAQPLHRLARTPGGLARFSLVPPTRDTRALIAAMDGLMLASRAESMPNVVLESFAQSTPVIAADVGDVARLVRTGETGWLVPPEDVSALATAIGDFVSAPADQLTSMGWQGRQRVESEHSLAQLCERTLAVYQEVLRPRESESARSSGR